MTKRIGKIIEQRLKKERIQINEFAKKLGKDRSTVYDIFSRDSIDTKLLEKIGQILGYDFFQDLLQPETVKEIVIKNSVHNRIFVELNLTDEEIERFGIKDKVANQLIT
jgi:transcriptional regulator with XRE-family HTH domain